MKICLIGVSGHTGYVLSGLAPDGADRLCGIAPGSLGENADALAWHEVVKAHAPEICADYRDMLDRLRPEVVVVACHFGDHAAVAHEAMERGCHVFIEKPIATTLDDLAALKAHHERAGVQLSAMHGMRYTPAFYTARECVVAGAIGEVRLLNGQKSYKLGSRPDFYRSRNTYGGTIPWVGSHAIDWLAWFSPGAFSSVFATHSAQHNRDHGDLEMTAHCLFTFSDGISGAVNVDYFRPDTAPSHGDDRLRIAGSNGIIEVQNDTVTLINQADDGIQTIPAVCERQIFGDFLAQIRGEGACLVTAEDAFRVTEACLLARKSADECRSITFPA